MSELDCQVHVHNPGPRTPENGWFRFNIGEMEAIIVSDGRLLPHGIAEFFPAVPPLDLHLAKADTGLDGTHFSMEQNCLVLRYSGHVVLFDTGIGKDRNYGWEHSGILIRSMAAAGVRAEEVTEIILTHAHCDHSWGLVDEGAPNFPNARLFVSRVDFEYWTDDAKLSLGGFTADCVLGARRNLLPYREKMTLIEGDLEILPNIFAVASPGHSPGHYSYVIGIEQDRYIFLGDVMHSSHLQMANPNWSCAYDFDQDQAAATRQRVLESAADQGLSIIGYHFNFPGIGKVERNGTAFWYTPASLSD